MGVFSFALAAAVIWGVSAVLEKMGLARADPLAGVLARALGVMAGGVVYALLVPQSVSKLLEMGWKSFWLLAAGGLMASVVAQFFFYQALKHGEIGRVSAVGGSWPAIAFLFGIFVFHQAPTVKSFLGLILVILGVVLLR